MKNENDDLLSDSNAEFSELRLRLRGLPSRTAPSTLIHSLRHEFIGPSWTERFLAFFDGPMMWKPIGALTVMALFAGVWIKNWKSAENNLMDLQPLVAAHARYQGESMVPSADLANSGFGFQLASYYGEEN